MNPNNTNNFFGIKVSKTGIPVQNASDKQLTYKNDYTTTTWYDNTNPRILEGKLPDGSYGLWVSKPGNDVTSSSAAINNQLIFNSNQDIFKIVGSGTLSWTLSNTANVVPAGTQTNTITHNLGFQPSALVYFSAPTTANTTILSPMPYTDFFSSGANKGLLFSDTRYFINTTQLIFQVINLVGSDYSPNVPTWNIKYYLLQETAT